MDFTSFLRQRSGCLSYLVGSRQSGTCVVIDPAWEVDQYLAAAQERGLRITRIIETHAHADHLSGARRLRDLTGAELLVHPSFGAAFPVRTLADGERIDLGDVTLQVLYTPGHRPDAVTLAVQDRTRGDEVWMLLTGDALFVGDVGRPDLGQDAVAGARDSYRTLFAKLGPFADWTELYPAHAGGSACGRALSSKPSSTLGFERRFNPAFQQGSLDSYVAWLLRELPAALPTFEVLLRKNRGELPLRTPRLKPLSPRLLARLARAGHAVLDLRDPVDFGAGAIPESLNAPLRLGDFSASAAWAVQPERPLLLVGYSATDAAVAAAELQVAGLDWVDGYLAGGFAAYARANLPAQQLRQLPPQELHNLLTAKGATAPLVIDVREREEWQQGHIQGARSILLSELDAHFPALAAAGEVAFVCGAGIKSAVAASRARAAGVAALNIVGGMSAWHRAHLSTQRGSVGTARRKR